MKLKPCPNCNLSPKKLHIWQVCGSKIFHKYYIECPSCHWCGKTKVFKWRAVRAWNKKNGERKPWLKRDKRWERWFNLY